MNERHLELPTDPEALGRRLAEMAVEADRERAEKRLEREGEPEGIIRTSDGGVRAGEAGTYLVVTPDGRQERIEAEAGEEIRVPDPPRSRKERRARECGERKRIRRDPAWRESQKERGKERARMDRMRREVVDSIRYGGPAR